MDKTSHYGSRDSEEFPARTAFWGICCESGKRYNQVVGQKFRITMAALEPSDVTTKPDSENFVSLTVERGGSEFVLCSLQQKNIMQVNLNLVFDQGEDVVFELKGQGKVHLTGYQISDGSKSCQPRFSDGENFVVQSPKQQQNLKKKSVQNQPVVKKKQVVTVLDNTDEEPSNDKTVAKKRKSKSQLSSSPVKRKENVNEMSEDEPQLEEVDVIKAKKEVVIKSSSKRLWDSLQKKIQSDEDEDDDDSEEEDEEDSSSEENSKDVLRSKVKPQKHAKLESNLKQMNFHGKLAEVVDLEEVEEEESSSSNEGMQEELNSSIGRTPMPGKKIQPKSPLSSPQFKLPESKGKKQKNEKGDVSILKVKGSALGKPFGKKQAGGVEVHDIRIGSGPPAKRGKFVHIYYVGRLPNGEIFDSRKPNEKPFSFKLGRGEVMQGMEIGLEGMKAGGKRRIKIPPELGLGKQGLDTVPPNSPLLFFVELKAVS